MRSVAWLRPTGDGALEASDELLRNPGRVVSIRDPQAAKERGGTYVFVRHEIAHLAALADLVEAGKLSAPRPVDL